MATFIQISDSHLGLPGAENRWSLAMSAIKARQPDFVLHTGDVTESGSEEQLRIARRGLDTLEIPWRAIPGNHDIGDSPPAGSGPDAAASERYDAALGPSRFTYPLDGWTIVGMSGLTFGTGRRDEAADWRWLSDALSSADGPTILAFHKPVFLDHVDELAETSSAMPTCARANLLPHLRATNTKLIVNGHRHAYRALQSDLLACVWAPSLAGPPESTPPMAQAPYPPGMVEFHLSPHGFQHQLIPLAGEVP